MVSIVIPAFNEEKAIKKILLELTETMQKSRLDYEIVFVDDGSYDNTAQIACRFPKVNLIRNVVNRGVGAAHKIGLRQAKGEIVVTIDADGTYPAQSIPELIQSLKQYDMLIGWRQREVKRPIFVYRTVKLILNKVVSFLMGKKILDLNSGLRAFKKEIAEKFFNIFPDSHSWASTLTISFLASGYSVGYIPINYRERLGKSSFLFWRNGWESLCCIAKAIVYFKLKKRSL